MDAIKSKATAFTLRYGAAMELSLNATNSKRSISEALVSCYKSDFTAFVFGNKLDVGATASQVESHLTNLEKSGLGYKIRLAKYDVVPYSESSAQCWLTWEIEPANGVEGWQWTNIYGFRIPPDGKGGFEGEGFFEYSVADHEIAGIVKRCPEFGSDLIDPKSAY